MGSEAPQSAPRRRRISLDRLPERAVTCGARRVADARDERPAETAAPLWSAGMPARMLVIESLGVFVAATVALLAAAWL
ncbi:MAG: hypothetical protein IPM29_31670 [Planctomycetes bacterium]|nr:hypothetical protein [Planctomycetota bacterium]